MYFCNVKMKRTMGKIKIEAYKGLKIVDGFLKRRSLANEAGFKEAVLLMKMKKTKNQFGTEYRLTEENVIKLNSSLMLIGERVQNSIIKYSENREDIINQLKILSKDLDMPYIYKHKLNKSASWFANRMRLNNNFTSFSEKDIVKINCVLWEIAAFLQNVELTLNENKQND